MSVSSSKLPRSPEGLLEVSPLPVLLVMWLLGHLPILALEHGSGANLFCKGPDSKYFRHSRSYSPYHNYSTLLSYCKSSRSHYLHVRAWRYFNKTLLTKTQMHELHLAPVCQPAYWFSGVSDCAFLEYIPSVLCVSQVALINICGTKQTF